MKRKPELGSISSGTMRAEDLIPAFLDVLDYLEGKTKRVRKWRAEWDKIDVENLSTCSADDQETADFILEDLFNALEEHAPDYCYFGANEGDGADYGFWVSWDSLQADTVLRRGYFSKSDPHAHDAEVLKVEDLAEIPADDRHAYIHLVNDHGNSTLYARRGNGKGSRGLREVWSVV